ncbi:BTB/POZ domain-containing protein 6-B-like [Nilaparvata lugens]|uniref:BTB/POZ domain-containing protein 6-B-like n=1 Tax=Nilaparvata lugens TaxID=108931 RepID=UPI00193D3023|nr:BTB/POZ domain-containing protein 6-B-like [Nilaparvata lugens]
MSFTPPSLKSKFELCLNNDDLSDCEFLVGEKKCKIKGHKLLFGISSPVFRDMLYDGLQSKNGVTYEVIDVEPEEFQGMKQFIYTDNVVFTSGLHACSVYLASWKYVIPDLMPKCVQYIKDNLSVTEVIDVFEFSRLNNIPDIEKICLAIFQEKTREVMQSEKFLTTDIHTLEAILKLDSLKLESELEVFQYVEKWALAESCRRNIDLQQQGEYFNCIKRHLRILTIDKEQYENGLSKSHLLTAEEKIPILHNLLGFEEKLPHTFSDVTVPRIFTVGESEEEQEEGDIKELSFTRTESDNEFNCEGSEYVLVRFRAENITIIPLEFSHEIIESLIENCEFKLYSLEKLKDSEEKIFDTVLSIENSYYFVVFYLKFKLNRSTGFSELQISLLLKEDI